MKKALIISFHHPLENEMGALRAAKLAKYLPSYGWEPIILTRAPQDHSNGIFEDSANTRVYITNDSYVKGWIKGFLKVATKYRNRNPAIKESVDERDRGMLSVIAHGVYRNFSPFPISLWEWYWEAKNLGKEILNGENIDLILSTSPPEVVHLVAHYLSKETGIPWVADFRDLWTQNPYHWFSLRVSLFRRVIERALEKRVIAGTSSLSTSTSSFSDALEALHKKKAKVVMNGFDEEDFQEIMPVQLTEKFTITYTGTIYHGKRNPSLLFQAVAELTEKKEINEDDVEIRFYGPDLHLVLKLASDFGISQVVGVYDKVSRYESLRRQMESQVLFLLQWMDPREKGICSGKIFEYFGAKRPVLAIGPGGVIKKLLNETGAGIYASTARDVKNAIKKYYLEYKSKGKVIYSRQREEISKYTYRKMTKRFSEILDEL